MGSTSALVIGFSFAGQDGWSTPRTLGLILTGIGGLLAAFVWETFVGSRALLPPGIQTSHNRQRPRHFHPSQLRIQRWYLLHPRVLSSCRRGYPVQGWHARPALLSWVRIRFCSGSSVHQLPHRPSLDRSKSQDIYLFRDGTCYNWVWYVYIYSDVQNVDIWAHHNQTLLTFLPHVQVL
jgi:hypothetical protein